ncbi:MAG: 1,4-dihydroxy-2-naphthoate polyprenyltransferase [Thermomicrobiales bacterium]|nr:1,4-dihydroxy-2-naphthoate polyprenyltransferase [Thermomicrobiales bacterium]
MRKSTVASAPRKPGSALTAWRLAIRPKTLPAAVAPILVGTAVAWREGGFHVVAALVALAVALLLQIASNLANDVLDFKKGADTHARVGPTRVTQSGLIAPSRVVAATIVVLALATLAGLYLVWRGGWPMLLLGALALISAVAYTGGPAPLGYLGLGEAFVFLFFGLVGVAGSAYVQTLTLTPLALWASLPIGCLVTNILVVNNLRDIATDRVAGKKTLAVRLGAAGARGEYLALLLAAYLTPLGLWFGAEIGRWWWLPWLTAPIAVGVARGAWATEGRALNPLLGATARLALLFAIPFAGSIAW